MSQRFYITTPIYYPNGEPHVGHVYTTLAADTVARYHRLRGDETFFLTGTDEHGIKMVKTAAELGVEPLDLATRMSASFRKTFDEFGASYDDFIRTTQPRHKKVVQEFVAKMVASGDIYLGAYEGWYDEGQEEFVTETEAKANEYKSKISGRPLTKYSEPTYFFRLSKYAPKVLEYIEQHAGFIAPESKRNEVVSKLKMGVEDLSISRATLKWGIEMPNDPGHVVYVWIDALSNYYSALTESPKGDVSAGDITGRFWPADVHLIGREILWFHAVYWPAMLMSLGMPLPKKIFAHGWWTSDGQKMSKSMGNFIDLAKLSEVKASYGTDTLRFYMLRAGVFGSDLDWNPAELNKANNELGNVLGNCLNRVLNMMNKYRGGEVKAIGSEITALDQSLIDATKRLPESLAAAYANLELQQAAMLPIELARATNGYVDATAPFSLAKDPAKAGQLDTVLHLSAQAIRTALVGLIPLLPEKAVAGLAQLGVDAKALAGEALWQPLAAGHKVGVGTPLFPKVEVEKK
jgi:methionyl-tRNA synthetase